NKLVFLTSPEDRVASNRTAADGTQTLVINGAFGPQKVVFVNGSALPSGLSSLASADLNDLRKDLNVVADAPVADAVSSKKLALFGNLGTAFRKDKNAPNPANDAENSSSASDDDNAPSESDGGDGGEGEGEGDGGGGVDDTAGFGILRQLFETGGFDLDDIGTTIDSLESLRPPLDHLDAVPRPVTLTTDDQGFPRFDVQFTKTIDGNTGLNLQALGGALSLNGSVDVSVDVHVHLVFGLDGQGFYIDADAPQDALGNPEPELTLSNL